MKIDSLIMGVQYILITLLKGTIGNDFWQKKIHLSSSQDKMDFPKMNFFFHFLFLYHTTTLNKDTHFNVSCQLFFWKIF